VAEGNMYYMGVQNLHAKGQLLWGKDMLGHARGHCRELCKMAEPIEGEMPFGLWTQVWPKEACMGVEIPHTKGHVFSENDVPGHAR